MRRKLNADQFCNCCRLIALFLYILWRINAQNPLKKEKRNTTKPGKEYLIRMWVSLTAWCSTSGLNTVALIYKHAWSVNGMSLNQNQTNYLPITLLSQSWTVVKSKTQTKVVVWLLSTQLKITPYKIMQYGLLFGVKDTVHIAEKKSPQKPIVVIVFLVLLSFCFTSAVSSTPRAAILLTLHREFMKIINLNCAMLQNSELVFALIWFPLAMFSSSLTLFSCFSQFHHSLRNRQKVTLILCHRNSYKGNVTLGITFCNTHD